MQMYEVLLALGGLATFASAAPQPVPAAMITPAPKLVPRQSASEFSVQPIMTGPQSVSYGDFNPVDLISSISAACTAGCGAATSTISATYVPSPAKASGIETPTPLNIEYTISIDAEPAESYGVIMAGLAAMVNTSSVNAETFTYNFLQPNVEGPPINEYITTTQYYGPQLLQFSRYSQDGSGNYVNTAGVFSVTITSQDVTSDDSSLCSDIVTPLTGALGLIPDVGGVFGIIGSLLCM